MDLPMQDHACAFFVVGASARVSPTFGPFGRLEMEVTSGPHSGRSIFYSYDPYQVGKSRAQALGLPLHEDRMSDAVGMRFRGRVRQIKTSEYVMNYAELIETA